jgi:thiosulfate dehydrogenase (quinone) large subunit
VEVGPLQSFFHAIAGTWWANGLFMLGLLAIGVALIAGVAMRIAAISGVVMLAMMWLAEVPFAQFTSAGEPTGSPNPFADSHFIYAVVLIVLAATFAGTTWGLGRTWARLPFVTRNRWAQ